MATKNTHKEAEDKVRSLEEYQNDPDYYGYEDSSTSGRAAAEAYRTNKNDEKNDYYLTKRDMKHMASKSGVEKAQRASKVVKEAEKTNPMGDTYKKGGSVSASSRADGMASRGKTRGKMC
jgi:hypothetical protein